MSAAGSTESTAAAEGGLVGLCATAAVAGVATGFLAATFAATLSATLLRAAPIYDPLRGRMERRAATDV